MEGENTLIINQETLCRAVQTFFNGLLLRPEDHVKVTAVFLVTDNDVAPIEDVHVQFESRVKRSA